MATTQPVGARPDWVDDELFPFESHFIEVDGNVIHYVDEGTGPTLLMLHGNPVWSFVYRDVLAALRDRFRCVALDFPGFGLSAAAPKFGFTAQEHADLLVTFIERLDLSELTLVGHNWGGPWGLYAAEQRRERFERLVLSNTWAWPLNGDPGSELFSRGMGNAIGRAMIKRFDLLGRYFIPSAHKRRKLTDAELTQYLAANPTPESRHAAATLPGQLVGARGFFTGLADGLDAVTDLPTLILWADRDPIFTSKYLRRLEDTFTNHTTTMLRGVGHFGPSDAAQEFSDAIANWWDQSVS